jgi:hypothetical protein
MAIGITQIGNFALFTIIVRGQDQKLSGYQFMGLEFFSILAPEFYI